VARPSVAAAVGTPSTTFASAANTNATLAVGSSGPAASGAGVPGAPSPTTPRVPVAGGPGSGGGATGGSPTGGASGGGHTLSGRATPDHITSRTLTVVRRVRTEDAKAIWRSFLPEVPPA
jgi:hypothetical protein